MNTKFFTILLLTFVVGVSVSFAQRPNSISKYITVTDDELVSEGANASAIAFINASAPNLSKETKKFIARHFAALTVAQKNELSLLSLEHTQPGNKLMVEKHLAFIKLNYFSDYEACLEAEYVINSKKKI